MGNIPDLVDADPAARPGPRSGDSLARVARVPDLAEIAAVHDGVMERPHEPGAGRGCGFAPPGQHPHPHERPLPPPLEPDRVPGAVRDPEGRGFVDSVGSLLGRREVVRSARSEGSAHVPQGAVRAPRPAGDADRRAKIHERLVRVARPLTGEQSIRLAPHVMRWPGRQQREAREDPRDVAVHRCRRQVVGDAQHRAHSVRADPGERGCIRLR